VVDYLSAQGTPPVRELNVVDEDVRFGLPHELIELGRRPGPRPAVTPSPRA